MTYALARVEVAATAMDRNIILFLPSLGRSMVLVSPVREEAWHQHPQQDSHTVHALAQVPHHLAPG